MAELLAENGIRVRLLRGAATAVAMLEMLLAPAPRELLAVKRDPRGHGLLLEVGTIPVGAQAWGYI